VKWLENIIWGIGIAVLLATAGVAVVTLHVSFVSLVFMSLLAMFSYDIYKKKKQLRRGMQIAGNPRPVFAAFRLAAIAGISGLFVMTLFTAQADNMLRQECSDSARYDVAIAACTRLIDSGEDMAQVFVKRSNAYTIKGLYDLSLLDLDQALMRDPEYVAAYSDRGMVFFLKGSYAEAIRDFDEYTRLMPHIGDLAGVNILLMRGVAKFYSASPQKALDDLASARTLDSADPLKVLWLHIARSRAGQDDKQEFEHNGARLVARRWPAPVVALYFNKMTVQEVLSIAKGGGASMQCEADFYIAQFHLQQKRKDEAIRLFEAVRDSCPQGVWERNAALHELRTTGSSR
jgi:lipoprotein NlpI